MVRAFRHEAGHRHVSAPAPKCAYPQNALERGNHSREENRGEKVLSCSKGEAGTQLAVEMPGLERFSQCEQ